MDKNKRAPLKKILWTIVIAIVVGISLMYFGTSVKTGSYDVQSINNQIYLMRGKGSAGPVTGLGFVIKTQQGRWFTIPFDINNKAEMLMNKLNSDRSLWSGVGITYISHIFGFSTDVTNVTLSDGEIFTFTY